MADNAMDIDTAMEQAGLDSSTPTTTTTTTKTTFKPRARPRPKGVTSKTTTTSAKPTIQPKVEHKDQSIPTPPPINPKLEPDTEPKIDAHVEDARVEDAHVEEEADVENAHVEAEEDEVEREIDVFLTPFSLDENQTEICLMQYPLRPKWHTYEMETRCTEVRMMPQSKQMEVDLRMDDDSQTFDADMASSSGKDKQSLRSLALPSTTDYAVGFLRKNQIHLSLINRIMQLRPVMRSDQQKRKHTTQQMDPETSSSTKMELRPVQWHPKYELVDLVIPAVLLAKTEAGDSAETEDDGDSWVPLEFLPEGSILSAEYYKKMVTTENTKIDFRMTQTDYIRALCPGESISRRETTEALIREVKKLPLEERLKKWFTETSQLNRFDFVEYMLAPDEPVEEVLKQVQMLADLVQGVWVTKTSILYEGYAATVRDYILLQFTKHDSIPCEKLRTNLGRDVLKNRDLISLFQNLIMSKPKEDKVKLKSSPDPTFRKRFKDVVNGQVEAWAAREESIMERVRGINKSGLSGNKRVVLKESKEKKVAESTPGHGDGGPVISANKLISVTETRNHLIEALNKIFEEQKVRKLRSVVRDLRELAKKLSALPKSSDRNKHLIDGALCGASASSTELANVVKQVAVHVHGVYVMKTPKKEHLRNVFILLFIKAKPKEILRKQDIMQRGREIFKREINESEYAQVVDDICIITKDGGLMLKDGD